MGYDQWCALRIHNHQDEDIVIRNANIEWGRWYEFPDKDNVIGDSNALDQIRISKDSERIIAARGDSRWSGTEGKFDLFTPNGHITTIQFASPYSNDAQNIAFVGWVNPDFSVERTDILRNPKKGPLGDVTYRIGRKGQVLPSDGHSSAGYKYDSDDDGVRPEGGGATYKSVMEAD